MLWIYLSLMRKERWPHSLILSSDGGQLFTNKCKKLGMLLYSF